MAAIQVPNIAQRPAPPPSAWTQANREKPASDSPSQPMPRRRCKAGQRQWPEPAYSANAESIDVAIPTLRLRVVIGFPYQRVLTTGTGQWR